MFVDPRGAPYGVFEGPCGCPCGCSNGSTLRSSPGFRSSSSLNSSLPNIIIALFNLQIFNLLTIGLRDIDSYVYLASINSLSTLCDLAPTVLFPLLSHSVSGRDPRTYAEQAKIGEALHFCFRSRDAVAAGVVGTSVARELLWGLSDKGKVSER